jgi:hypothetical protein
MSRKVALILMIICSSAMALAKTPTPSPPPMGSNQSNGHTNVATSSNPAIGSTSPAKEDVGTEKVKWTDVWDFRVLTVGIVLQLFALGLVWRQIEKLKQGIQGETHSKLYDHYLKVNELLSQQSRLRPYFYNQKVLKEDAAGYADLRDEIDMMCEVIAGLLEHATVQEVNLPRATWETCWKAYTYERFEKSPELRQFFHDNQEWYAEPFRKVVGRRYPELIKPCNSTAGGTAVSEMSTPVALKTNG